jgi:HAMP domain-containing protein
MSVMDLSAEIRKWFLGMPVLVKVMGIALGMAAFLGAGLFWQIQMPYSRLENEEIETHAEFVAQTVANGVAPLLASGGPSEVQAMLDRLAQITPAVGATIKTIELRDGSGHLLAQASRRSPPAKAKAGRLIENRAALPGGVAGSVRVVLDDAHIDFELAWHTRRILATTGTIALLGVAATWWLMGLVIHPIHGLVKSTRAVEEGDYQVRAPVPAKDEVGELAAAFNSMATALQLKNALKIVVVTMHEDETYVRQAILAGATGFIPKKSLATELLTAVRAVCKGQTYVASALAGAVTPTNGTALTRSKNILMESLAPREREVVSLVALGNTMVCGAIANLYDLIPGSVSHAVDSPAPRSGQRRNASKFFAWTALQIP